MTPSEKLRAATAQLRTRLDEHARAIGVSEADESVRRVRERVLAEMRAATKTGLRSDALLARLLDVARDLLATEAIADAARQAGGK